MKRNHLIQLNSQPGFRHRKRTPNPACLSLWLLRSSLLCAVFFVLTALGPGDTVADCISPISLWKLEEEESGAVSGYQDEFNPGEHIGACRMVDSIAVCPEPKPGRYGIGQRFYVNGQPSGISIPSSEIFNWASTDSFSISFWMKRNDTPPEENEVIIGRNATDEEGNKLHWWIGVRKSGIAMAVFLNRNREPISASNKYLRTDKILTDNHWHAIVFVRNGVTSESRLYVDGQLEDKVFVSYGDDGFGAYSTPVTIGFMDLGGNYQYKGVVDEIALYDTALPQWFIHDRYHADARYASDQTDPCD